MGLVEEPRRSVWVTAQVLCFRVVHYVYQNYNLFLYKYCSISPYNYERSIYILHFFNTYVYNIATNNI